MRVLMIGPWQAAAMRRHIDWAVAGGMEVQVADFPFPGDVVQPSGFRLTPLLPRRVARIDRASAHRKSQRASQAAVLRLQRLAATFQPHIVHSYMLNRYTDLSLRAGLRPLAVSAWGFLNQLMAGPPAARDRRWLRRLQQGAAALLVENPNLLTALHGLSLAPLRVECFPLGVDGSLFHPGYSQETAAWRFALDIPDDAVVLLSPRGWSPVYGQHHIMSAFALAFPRLPSPSVLVLLGLGRQRRPETYAQQVLDLGASLGVSHAVRWIPQVPHQDMPGLYALADAVISYPATDALPSTLLEAAACARPTITSRLPAYRNTFVEQSLKLVEPENPQALADAIVEVAGSHAAAWAARALAARPTVLATYDERLQQERLISLYHELARRSPLRPRKKGLDALADPC